GVPTPIGPEQVASAVSTLLTIFDRTNGGFGGAPKFPQPAYLEFLLEARTAIDAASAGAMDAAARQTLDRMALGGVFDQAGGGFHRYSVDASWLVPHFEKMLYDNGQLLETYARAARVYRSALYERVARRTAAYVLREMTAPDGAFFTAQDAEVDGREGLNYLWTMEDFRSVLGADAPRAARLYGVDLGPNFRDPHHPDAPAVNVLRLEAEPDEPTAAWLDGVNQRLLAARGRRAQPRRDDKVLAAWNGLMIGGLAVAGRELGEAMLVEAAARGARGALGRLWRADEGRLLRCERAGGEPAAGTLEDYAMMAHGLLALAAARPDERAWVDRAAGLVGAAERRLGDGAGGFFDAEEGAESLFVRPRSTYDGAMPCGASVMINAMIDLHAFDGAGGWLRRAAKCLATVSAAVADSPVGSINATRGLLRLMRADRSALREAVPEGAPAGSGTGGAPAGDVSVWASTTEVYVLPDRPAAFVLRLEVPEGLHINDATADADSGGAVTALRVDVAGGTGFAAYADYPTGRPLDGAGHRVLDGVVEFEVAVEAQGDVTGSPFIAVSYQACSDRACRQPVVQRLDVLLKRGQGPYAAGLA
ncbi:MAG: thioredoxin domain-containing protein, partial [Phycisphaeraceae bacterium]|nr:thioredoxin domain-containing protein [Phycisphaeraceae bacterium]